MRRLILVAVAVLAVVLVAPASTATITVQAKDAAFSPATVTINQDDSVAWKNTGKNDHQIVANTGAFASPILAPGKSYAFKFTRAGTYKYHDALHPTLKGTITVKGPPPSLTLGASAPIVSFGAPTTLTGAVSSKAANETVAIMGQPFGQTVAQVLATLKTGPDGTFSFQVMPQIGTTYMAQWGAAKSEAIQVQVAPKIKLPRPVRGWFHTYVTAAASFAGHPVFLQRLSRFGEWYSVAKFTLGAKSGRIFRAVAYLPRGLSHIRIAMTESGNGYLSAASGTQKVVKR